MIKKVELKELDSVMEIIEDARRLLSKTSGQWQQGYPNRNTLKEDIEKERLYGFYDEDGYLLGVSAFINGYDEYYLKLDEGSFIASPSDEDLVIHRIAVREGYHGYHIGDSLVKFGIGIAKERHLKSVKTDTHKKNIRMQKLVTSNGLEYRGTTHMRNGETDDERIVFELVL